MRGLQLSTGSVERAFAEQTARQMIGEQTVPVLGDAPMWFKQARRNSCANFYCSDIIRLGSGPLVLLLE